ncbi:MAG: thiamine pyrophosphate-binding protein, partial [Halobacteriota archaeon]
MEDNDASGSATLNPHNIGAYIIERLQSLGVSHVFGVPGDYVLGFFKQLSDSQLNLVTT